MFQTTGHIKKSEESMSFHEKVNRLKVEQLGNKIWLKRTDNGQGKIKFTVANRSIDYIFLETS
jgi:hypothetical protein